MALVQQGRLTDEQLAEQEAKRTANDMKAAAQRNKEEKERIDAIAKADAEKRAKKALEAEKAKNEVLKRQIGKRQSYLESPLDDADKGRLSMLEEMANSGKTVPVDLMKELADLRIRSKVKTKKK